MLIYLLYLLFGLLAIGFVIFLHELGHFTAARLLGVDVEVLSYGMGPKLFSFQGPKTEYRISLFLFGGYCRMKGSLDLMKALKDDARSMDKTEAGSYFGTTPVVRFLIYLAGPLMNFLLAVLLLALSSLIPVERLSDPAVVTPISEYGTLFNSDIIQSNIQKGDILIASGKHIFEDWQDAEDFIKTHSGEIIPVTVCRDDKFIETELIPTKTVDGYAYGITLFQEPVIGRSKSTFFLPGDRIVEADGKKIECTLDIYSITSDNFTVLIERDGKLIENIIENGHLPFAWYSDIRDSRDSVSPLLYGLKRSASMFVSALRTLGAFITFHLEDALTVMTGPVKAAESIGHITAIAFQTSAPSGLRSLLLLCSIISISLSVGNILPIPTFDGGQMLINITEMIYRRELSPRSYVMLQIVGMILALFIMIMMYSLDVKAYFFS